MEYPTSLGTSDADTITLLGQNLADDLMGKVGFGELTLWMVTQRRPTQSQVRVFEAVLVALADHGFTPTAIAARLTYLSAPDSIQGALAAGLLGGGSRFLGVTEDCGQFLAGVLAEAGEIPADDAGFDALALAAVTKAKAERKFVPGLGHPVTAADGPPCHGAASAVARSANEPMRADGRVRGAAAGGDSVLLHCTPAIEGQVPATEHAAGTEATDEPAVSRRSWAPFIAGLMLAYFGASVALFAPVENVLPRLIESAAGSQHKAVYLGLVTGLGAVAALVFNPLAAASPTAG